LLHNSPSGDAATLRHRERRPLLASEVVTCRRIETIGHGGARQQPDDVDRLRSVGVQDLVDRIERGATPVDAAAGHRKHHRPPHRRRRVEPVVACRRNLRATGRDVGERDHAERPSVEIRCGTSAGTASETAAGELPPSAPPAAPRAPPPAIPLAGVAIEHEHEALLGRLITTSRCPPRIETRQRRLRR
jgi:hypothetical protein